MLYSYRYMFHAYAYMSHFYRLMFEKFQKYLKTTRNLFFYSYRDAIKGEICPFFF